MPARSLTMFVAAAVIVCALASGVWLYLDYWTAYSRAEVSTTPLGGQWVGETMRAVAGPSGGHTALYRRRGSGRKLVASVSYKPTYVGDDCIVYSTRNGCQAACGDRDPIVLVDYCDRWSLSGGSLVVIDPSGSEARIAVSEIKRRATEVPDRTREPAAKEDG